MDMTLIIQRSAPYGSLFANESLDLALGFAVMDCETRMLFVDDGVLQLLRNQSPTTQKNLSKNLAALPLYGVEKLYCDSASLQRRNLAPEQLIDGVEVLDNQQIQQLIAQASRCFAL